MADEVVQLVLRARDEASAKVKGLANEVGALPGLVGRLSAGLGVWGALAAGATAAAGAIVAMGKKYADAAEELNRTSIGTGVATSSLQALRRVIEDGGGSAESLGKALGALNRSIATGDPLLAQLGITTRDTETAFLQLMKVLAGSKDTAARTEIAYRLLGKSGGELASQAREIAENTKAMEAVMRSTGEIIEGGPLKAALALDSQMERLDQNWRGSISRIGGATVPWAADMITAFNNLWDAISGNKIDTTSEIDRKMAEIQRDIEQAETRRAEMVKARATGAPDYSTRRSEMIELETRGIAELVKKIEELAKARRQLAGVTDQDRLKSIHGDGSRTGAKELADVLAAADAAAAAAKSAEKREAALRDLQRSLGVTRERAMQLSAALEQLDRTDALDKLRERLNKALPPGGIELPVTFVPAPNMAKDLADALNKALPSGPAGDVGNFRPTFPKVQMPEIGSRADFDVAKHNARLKQWLELQSQIGADWALVSALWKRSIEEMTNALALLDQATSATFNGMQSGLGQVLGQIGSETQTIRSAWSTLLRSMWAEYAAFLAKLAAAKILRFLIDLVPGGKLIPALPGAKTNALSTGRGSEGLAAAGAGRGVTIINNSFNALDTRGLKQQVAYGGSLTRAQEQSRIGAQY